MQTYYLSKKNIKKYRSLARANDIVSLNLVWKDTVKALKMTGSHSDRNAKFEMIWQSDARGYTADVLPDGFGCVCSCYSVSWESFLPGMDSVTSNTTACWPQPFPLKLKMGSCENRAGQRESELLLF